MALTSGTQVQIGIGIESAAAPGTAVAETYFLPWTSYSMQGVSEKSHFNAARGIRNMSSNSMIKRKYGQGSVAFIPDVKNMPYFLSLALGSTSSSAVADSAYTHTFTVQNTNTSVRTATFTIAEGAVETVQYVNSVVDTLDFEVSDDYASCTVGFLSKFPGSDTISPSYTTQTEFAYHQYTAKFGTSLTAAASNAATPLKQFAFNLKNNILLDEAFLSGSNDIVVGGLIPARLQVTGSYSLQFSSTTELAKYQANTKNALIVTFTGALIGASSLETLIFKFGKLVLTKPPMEYNIDGLILLKQEFEVEFDATDSEMSAVVINAVVNTSGATYNPA